MLSLGLSFRRSKCMVARVDSMLERIRDENITLLVQICSENLSTNALKNARSRLAARTFGPCQELRILKSWVCKDVNPPPRFRMRTLPFSRSSFCLLTRLVLGKFPVGRLRAMWQYRSSLSAFGESWFGKRAFLYCFLKGDTSVLDSDWHRMFYCTLFSELCLRNSYLFEFFKSLRK